MKSFTILTLSLALMAVACSKGVVNEHKALQSELDDYATLYPANKDSGSLFIDGFEIKSIAIFEFSLDEIDDIGREYLKCSKVYLDGFDTLINYFYTGGILYLVSNECALPSEKIKKIRDLYENVKDYSPTSKVTKPWDDLSKLHESSLDKLYLSPPRGNSDPIFWTKDHVAICIERSHNSKSSDLIFDKDENFNQSLAESCRQQLFNYGKKPTKP